MKVRKICKKLEEAGYDMPSVEIFQDGSGIIRYLNPMEKEVDFENTKHLKKKIKKMTK